MRADRDPWERRDGRTARRVGLGALCLVAVASVVLAFRVGSMARRAEAERTLRDLEDALDVEADRAALDLRALLDRAAAGDPSDARVAVDLVEAAWVPPVAPGPAPEVLERAQRLEVADGGAAEALEGYRAASAEGVLPGARVEALRGTARLLERLGDASGAARAREAAVAVSGAPDDAALLARFDAARGDEGATRDLLRSIEGGSFPAAAPMARSLLHRRLGGDPSRARGLLALSALLDRGQGAPGAVRVGEEGVAWPVGSSGPTRRFAWTTLSSLLAALVPGVASGRYTPVAAGGRLLADPPFPEVRLDVSAAAAAEVAAQADAAGRRAGLPVAALGVLLGLGAGLLAWDDRRREALARREHAFLSSVTHELKTPIANVRLYAETLIAHGAADPARVPEFAAIIATEAGRLEARVGEMLDVAAGRRALAPADATFDVRGVLDRAVQEARARRPDRAIEWSPGIAGDRALARGSADLFREAVDGLLDNALKFAPAGPVRVSLARDGRTLVVRVEDEGPGIPAADRERVFEPFVRLDAAVSGAVPGTGLGLSLVRQCIEACGGHVGVEPRAGPGAVLRVGLHAVEAP